MSLVYQCDRCNKQQDVALCPVNVDGSERDNSAKRLRIWERPFIRQELCIECTKALREWQNNPQVKYGLVQDVIKGKAAKARGGIIVPDERKDDPAQL